MGQPNSKRVYRMGPQGAKPGAQGADTDVVDDNKKDEVPPEDTGPSGPLDKREADKWKPFFKDILKLPEVKDKIKNLILNDKAAKGEDEYGKKGIILSENDVADFVNGQKDYIADLILFLNPDAASLGVPSKQGEPPVKFDQTAAEPLTTGEQANNNGKQIRNLKPGTTFKMIEASIIDPLIAATRLALKHKKFLRVLRDYILKTDSFKNAHKEEFIEGNKEDIKSGDKTVANALDENKEKTGMGDKPEKADAAEEEEKKGGAGEYFNPYQIGANRLVGGDDDSDGGGYDSDGASSNITSSTYDSVRSDGGSDGGSIDESIEGGSVNSMEGGLSGYSFIPNKLITDKKLKKLKGKEDYKKFKKESRKSFAEKTKQFFSDTFAIDTFMEENESDILGLMYYQRGVPLKWIDKSNQAAKKSVASALVQAITKYAPPGAEAGTEGAQEGAPEGAPEESGTDVAPAPAAGEGDAPEKKPEGDGPAGDGAGEKKTGEGEEEDEANKKKGGQGGGGGITKGKKKKFTRKKSRGINISINVGNKNVISDSSSSSSDTSSSSSSSSSSSDEEEESITINKKKRKNKSKA